MEEIIPQTPPKRKRNKVAYSEPKRRKTGIATAIPVDPSDSDEEVEVLIPKEVILNKDDFIEGKLFLK